MDSGKISMLSGPHKPSAIGQHGTGGITWQKVIKEPTLNHSQVLQTYIETKLFLTK